MTTIIIVSRHNVVNLKVKKRHCRSNVVEIDRGKKEDYGISALSKSGFFTKFLTFTVLQESWIIVQDVYTNNPTEFSLKIYHYGHFSSTPGRTYDDGVITFVDYLEANQFKFSDMSLIIPQLGYGNTNNMWFYFKIPGGDLDTWLVPMKIDEDVSRLVSYTGVEGVKEISLYVVRCEVDANTGKE
ncbi:hypothetical protein QVD17_19859 [Tagetes erecta]|uniref:PB1-like domain-containing protein n=1 Tax=Tagetes erecta TaxID=13708 RepID=A0AAD8KK75_TARER|nr:hypothetical protein QVD17_19859 [Tagetes erecta]